MLENHSILRISYLDISKFSPTISYLVKIATLKPIFCHCIIIVSLFQLGPSTFLGVGVGVEVGLWGGGVYSSTDHDLCFTWYTHFPSPPRKKIAPPLSKILSGKLWVGGCASNIYHKFGTRMWNDLLLQG